MSAEHAPAAQLELSSGLTVRTLRGFGELKQACQLYRLVFDYSGEDESLNPRLLSSLLRHSGSVVGAVDPSGTVLAFAYGWTAIDTSESDPHAYHFSQAAVVSSALQGQGIGRSLKRVQAAAAADAGVARMRWTYDPLMARNAHFNLDVLAAHGRWYSPEAQGWAGSDRITVDWRFTAESPAAYPAPAALTVGETRHEGSAVLLGVPAAKPADPDLAAALRERIHQLFTAGHVAVSCQRASPETAVYRFERT